MKVAKCRFGSPTVRSGYARSNSFRRNAIPAFWLVAAVLAAPAIPTPANADDGVHASVSQANPINGSIVLVDVTVPPGLAKEKVSGEFEGISLPFYDTSVTGTEKEAVLGIPYEHAAGPAVVKITVGASAGATARKLDVPFTVTEGQYPHESIKVAARFARPSKKAVERAVREAKEVGLLYRKVTDHKYWQGPFQFPVKDVVFRSVYGTYRIYNDGARKRPHFGLDFKAAIGTPIYAPAAGKVVMAKKLYFTGNTVILDHGYGLITLYAHMSKLKIKVGAEVATGTLLGLSGMTGQVTGPHLHWQCMVHSQKVNPLDLTKIMR